MFEYICLFVFLVVFSVTCILLLDTQNRNRVINKIEKFESYVAILEYHMKKAYDIIYKDKILIYSLESVKINDIEFNVVSKDFAVLVMKLIGDNLKEEFIELYGSEETFIFNLIEYFNSRFENDEIREKARENIMVDND